MVFDTRADEARPSLDVCIPVCNRGDLLRPCVASLRRHLAGIDAAIWLVDNGSDAPTRDVIRALSDDDPFPHDTAVDVDWQLTVRHPQSIAASAAQVV